MSRRVAFLRAINVGGRVVTMAELCGHFEGIGFKDVQTFIASGNVVFASKAADATLQARIEKGLLQALGYEVATFVRSDAELVAITKYQAFSAAQLANARTNVVGFVAGTLSVPAKKALMALQNEHDTFHVHGREIYWISLKGQSDSTFSNVQLERTLKMRTTFRGMNTIVRLVAKFGF